MHDVEVIDISSQPSSPSPPPEQIILQNSRNAKGKGRMNDVEVIELTDDDDAFDSDIILTYVSNKDQPMASSSSSSIYSGHVRKKRRIVELDIDSDDVEIAARGTSPTNGILVSGNKQRSSSPRVNGILGADSSCGLSSPGRKGTGGAAPTAEGAVTHTNNGKHKGKGKAKAVDEEYYVECMLGSPSPTMNGKEIDDEDTTHPQLPHSISHPPPSVVRDPLLVGSIPANTSKAASSVLPIKPGPMNDPPLVSVISPVTQTATTQTATAATREPIKSPSFIPPPLVETPEETMSRYVAQVLEIIPDVDPEHCAAMVADHYPNLKDATVERLLHLLFEDPSYPKVKKVDKGKRKADETGEGIERSKKKAKVDREAKAKEEDGDDELWLNTERPFVGGRAYHDLALNQLQADYPLIPKAYLREQLTRNKGFYAPTFFFIRELERRLNDNNNIYQGRPYERREKPYKPAQAKGKQKAKEDKEFARELGWVVRLVAIEEDKEIMNEDEAEGKEAEVDTEDNDENDDESDGEDDENGIECGCCFSKFRFEKMSQCPDAHLFCRSCLRSYASTLLGSHNSNITCMSQSVCTSAFSQFELLRVLPPKTYLLYERLIQAKEIAEANLEGLEECPFCEWKCVFDVGFEGEKLFRCGNDVGGCGVVSCRKCKKLDHLPKSCEEVEKDRKLDARHAVEEAMTQALVRDCPKCKKSFIKEGGCNKMMCPNCRTMSCYICREIISGYEHFNQHPGRPGASSSSNSKKCVLWDKDLDAMHANEVKNAAEKALAEAQMLHPDVSISDLKVDLPKAAKKPQQHNPANPYGLPVIDPLPIPPLVRVHRRAALNQRLAHPPLPLVVPRAPVPAQRGGRGGRANARNGGVVRRDPPLQPPQPIIPPQPYQLQQQPARQQQPPHPQVPPPTYHEAVAQAMMGQYQPAGGGVEIGGRLLRNRAGRGVGVDGQGQGQGQVPPGHNGIHEAIAERERAMMREQLRLRAYHQLQEHRAEEQRLWFDEAHARREEQRRQETVLRFEELRGREEMEREQERLLEVLRLQREQAEKRTVERLMGGQPPAPGGMGFDWRPVVGPGGMQVQLQQGQAGPSSHQPNQQAGRKRKRGRKG